MKKINSNAHKHNDDDYVEYEEVFVGQEIEVDEDEEIEFVYLDNPPPPPYPMYRGGFPVPPPPYFRPTQFEVVNEYDEDEYDEDEYEDDEDEYEETAFQNNIQEEPKKPKTFSELTPPELKAIESQGAVQAELVKSARRFDFFKKIISYTAIFAGIFALIVVSVYLVLNQASKVVEKQEVSISKTAESQKGRFDLENKSLNTLLEKFYSTIGDIAFVSNYKDMLIRGSIKLKDVAAEEFYCIKRSDGNIYLKIGDSNNVSAFLISSDDKGVFSLPDLRTKGRKVALKPADALVIRAVASFDELLFKRLFDKYRSQVLSADIKYIGMSIDGERAYESASLVENDLKVKYNFNQSDFYLNNVEMKLGDNKAVSYFSDFRKTNADLSYPYSIVTKINGDTLAELKISSITVNRGLMLP